MKKELKPKYKNISLLLLLIILSIIILFSLIKNTNKNKDTPKENNQEKETVENTKKEEILNEDISILLPSSNDICEIDNCITNYTKNKIYNYFIENNYEQINRNSSIYFRNSSILIKIDENKENIEKEKYSQYDHYFNRYTTIDDLIKIINNQNINIYIGEKATEIAVLNYHFFYDKNEEKCNESICLDISNFEKQLNYLKENNYKTLTIEEYRSWLYKEIDLPKKSVLLTIDDGAMGTSKINGNKLIPLLEKYEINATLFLITGWWKKENYQSTYLDIQSHTHLMHDENQCSNKNRGAEMLCSTKEQILSDLKQSLNHVDNNTSFCYPFYLYDNKSIEALKELDFKLAFIGGNKKTTQENDKYKLPRYIIYKNTSLNSFISMVN